MNFDQNLKKIAILNLSIYILFTTFFSKEYVHVSLQDDISSHIALAFISHKHNNNKFYLYLNI
jgi:hypothetical protein